MENKNNNIGALWVKQSQKGDFFTGRITTDSGEEIKIVVFKNNYKNNEKQPDYTILKAREQEQQNNVEFETTQDDLPF